MKPEIPNCSNCNSITKSVFCDLSAKEIEAINAIKGCGFYKKGDIVFKEGYATNGVYCINKGKVKLSQIGAEGKEQIIRFAQDGDIMGYKSLLSGESLATSATVLEDASVCFIPKEHIFDLIATNSNFNLKVLKKLSHEISNSTKMITDLAQKPVKERLSEALLILKKTFELDTEKTIQVKLSREELANVVGTSTESVIRLLAELKRSKLIAVQRREITILDVKGLMIEANVFD